MLSWRTLFRCLPIMGWRWRLALPLAVSVVHTYFLIIDLALLGNLLCAQVWVWCSWRDGNVRATLWDSFSSSFQECVVQRWTALSCGMRIWHHPFVITCCQWWKKRIHHFLFLIMWPLLKCVKDWQFLFWIMSPLLWNGCKTEFFWSGLCHLSWEMGKRLPIFVPDCATSLAKWVKDCQFLFLLMPPLLWKRVKDCQALFLAMGSHLWEGWGIAIIPSQSCKKCSGTLGLTADATWKRDVGADIQLFTSLTLMWRRSASSSWLHVKQPSLDSLLNFCTDAGTSHFEQCATQLTTLG